jgi:hypothetical protein
MFKRPIRTTYFLFIVAVFGSCSSSPEKKVIQFEILNTQALNDSISVHYANYKEDFNRWKTVYEQCIQHALFPNALYLGLQDKLWIGSISNQIEQNVNKQITVLDTSANGNILDLLAIYNSANCFVKIDMNKSMQNDFYKELIKNLSNSGHYQYLAGLVDTNQISFNITTLLDYSIRPDTLINMLQRTKDSSLLKFKEVLITPGNVLLVRTAMIFGFSAQFHLKKRLLQEEEDKLKNEVFVKLGDHGENLRIKGMSDQNVLRVSINRNYTVFGQFFSFK